jgi:hypothetical protein
MLLKAHVRFLATVLSVKGFWNETDETMHSTASLF